MKWTLDLPTKGHAHSKKIVVTCHTRLVAAGQCPMLIAELRTPVSTSVQFSGPGRTDGFSQTKHWDIASHDDTFTSFLDLHFFLTLFSDLYCLNHSVLRQSGHCGGEEQWQVEPLYRTACWGDGSYVVQKRWLLKRNKGQRVRNATIVLGLPWPPYGSQPTVLMSAWSSNLEQSESGLWPPQVGPWLNPTN